MTFQDADQKLAQLLRHTLEKERLIGARDRAVNAIMDADAPVIATASEEIARLEAELEEFCRLVVTDEQKHLQLAHGRIGLRAPASPALIPLSDKWTWAKIGARLKRLYKLRFFHSPKPPSIDKAKIKRDLTVEQLAAAGMKLDDTEHFYVDLNRLSSYQEAA